MFTNVTLLEIIIANRKKRANVYSKKLLYRME